MKKYWFILAVSLVILVLPVQGSVTRLYLGDIDGQFMAGVDARVDFSFLYLGGDVRTVIRKTEVGTGAEGVSFLPDRTDYKTFGGFHFGNIELEVAHTCYHRVISDANMTLYAGNINLEDTDTVTVRYFF